MEMTEYSYVILKYRHDVAAGEVLNVGVDPVRAFFGVMSAAKARHGIFVTTGTFTKPATCFAKGHVELISGEQL